MENIQEIPNQLGSLRNNITKKRKRVKINTNPRMHMSHNFEWLSIHNQQSQSIKSKFKMKLPQNHGEYLDHLVENGYEIPPNIWEIHYGRRP